MVKMEGPIVARIWRHKISRLRAGRATLPSSDTIVKGTLKLWESSPARFPSLLTLGIICRKTFQ